MRRSKSNPAKYARKYSSISQRRMTAFNDVDDTEIDQIKRLMQTTSSRIEESSDEKNNFGEHSPDLNIVTSYDTEPYYSTDNTAVILPTVRKKKDKVSNKACHVSLTAEETKAAKLAYKKLSKKLQQLEQRRMFKDRRQELYRTLENHALTKDEASLMTSSSTLGKQKLTKKEMLRKLLKMERAGIVLTDEQRDLLYSMNGEKEPKQLQSTIDDTLVSMPIINNLPDNPNRKISLKEDTQTAPNDTKQTNQLILGIGNNEDPQESVKSVTLQMLASLTSLKDTQKVATSELGYGDREDKKFHSLLDCSLKHAPTIIDSKSREIPREQEIIDKPTNKDTSASFSPENSMKKSAPEIDKKRGASLLQTTTNSLHPIDNNRKRFMSDMEHETSERERSPVIAKFSNQHSYEKEPLQKSFLIHPKKRALNWRALSVNRPDDVTQTRNNLPITAMEYEIVDSVRNNHVTILCSDTGSGKSTQVPQFLYESGITLGNAVDIAEDEGLLIGVTQPRRIAAISTAKRVCYEMGLSEDGGLSIRNIQGEGNLVAYQTRYETAGLGSRTRIKFMTDGILLQEIKSDLLLRQYGAIILDEAHERNLNTDVLLGFLNASISLRDKAATEGSLPPLKVIIMSATLRVDDFVGNSKLFQLHPPNVVQVSGRTFPVTVHHSKVTELEKYENLAFKKVCHIHKKLPHGGILVFLTGQQEIVRMVQRLNKVLGSGVNQSRRCANFGIDRGNLVGKDCNVDGPREMDDDEDDGNLYNDGEFSIDGDSSTEDDDQSIAESKFDHSDCPDDVLVLPLYSMLSAADQAKIFQPIPTSTRLIVVSTNISETSLTIPNIKYVVDSGRQKCRNYHSATGVASYDIMWISQASANQRAGRAGRTGPGHCYRLYSASVYARQFDSFTLPEILVRPIEEVVLALKSMKISNICDFPFPTPPDRNQVDAAMKLLASIGCIEISQGNIQADDGVITKLGEAVSKLPVSVRYGKMLIAASDANILDYGIALVAILSESCPFVQHRLDIADSDDSSSTTDDFDTSDKLHDNKKAALISGKVRWANKGGDLISSLLAFGAYSYASRDSKGNEAPGVQFCQENGLNPVIMQRICKMHNHLSKLIKNKLANVDTSPEKASYHLLKPPSRRDKHLLQQVIVSGLLDHIARRTDPNTPTCENPKKSKAGYFSCQASITEQLFIDTNSVLHSRDYRQLPEWVCYDHIVRKTTKHGRVVAVMKNVTPIDPRWLGNNILKHFTI